MRRHLGTEAPALHAVLMAAWLCLPACALAQSPSAEDISSCKYCANCHANAHLIWAGKHGTKADSRAPVSVGCMMCHGDPAEHVKSPANPMPRRFSKMASAEKNEVCLTCHQGRTRVHWQGSKHERNDVSCSSCHQLHAASDPVRDKLTQTDVCFACHKDIRPMINRPSLILLDEPTGAVDTETAEQLVALLKRLNKEDMVTIIVVTHDLDIAAQTSRNIRLKDGKVMADERIGAVPVATAQPESRR